MSSKYVYRLDDITPDMNWEQFCLFMKLFAENNIVPLLGVVPDNKDPNLSVGRPNESFWNIIRNLQNEGKVEVAQHGYRHELAKTKIKGYKLIKFGMPVISEFVGLPYTKQYEMIKSGMNIIRSNGIYTDVWMSPCHTFDETTLDVLSALGFKSVTDGIAMYPFKFRGLIFVPQQLWKPRRLPFGVYTICLHINDVDERLYNCVKKHIESDACIIRFSEAVDIKKGKIGLLVNAFFRIAYILLRYMKHDATRKRGQDES